MGLVARWRGVVMNVEDWKVKVSEVFERVGSEIFVRGLEGEGVGG